MHIVISYIHASFACHANGHFWALRQGYFREELCSAEPKEGQAPINLALEIYLAKWRFGVYEYLFIVHFNKCKLYHSGT